MDRLVIRGGTVVDGTGAPGVDADVAIEGDRIVEVGPNLRGDRELDAGGAVVAPGFIDIHTHYDAQVFWDPALTPSCFHGVTTVVAGNCGFSLAPTRPSDRDYLGRTMEKVEDMDPACLAEGIPWDDFETFPQYLDAVRRRGSVLNFSAYLGHTALRLYVMGREASDRAATPEEIDAMARLVAEAMDAGAMGFATSLGLAHRGADGRPIPSRVAERSEFEALFRVVGDAGRGVVGVNGGTGLTFRDCYDLQPEIGAPITFTAILTTPGGAHVKAMDIHHAGLSRGADVWPQVTCRPLVFSMTMAEPFNLNPNPVFAELMPRSFEERRAAYADPTWRQRVRDAWETRQAPRPRLDAFSVMESTRPELIGKSLEDIPRADGADLFDVLLDLALGEPDMRALRFTAIIANDDTDGVAMLLHEPKCTIGLSDAGAHISQLCDAPQATDLLGTWVRDRQVLTVEDAVRKMTKVQADLFGIPDRGVLAPGAFADVVVFEPDTVAPGPLRRVRDFPAGTERLTADRPSGVRHVLVNGTAIRLDGDQVESAARPGRVVTPTAH